MKLSDIRVVASDIDGTLVNEDRSMLPITRKAVEFFFEKGIPFGISSGRPMDQTMLDRYKGYGLSRNFDFFITMNGGQIYEPDTDTMIEIHKMTCAQLKEVTEAMHRYSSCPFVYVGEGMNVHMLGTDPEGMARAKGNHDAMPVVKAKDESELYAIENHKILFRMKEEDVNDALAYFTAHPVADCAVFRTQKTLLEFQNPDVTKGVAYITYCKNHRIPMENAMAFGDMDNDWDIVRKAGYGIALLNGTTEVKKVAYAVTDYDNENDGLGRYVFDHIEV